MKNADYYQNPLSDSLTTRLISAELKESLWFLEFEDTLFYPEGGGQPADKGRINGEAVLDVQKEGDRILHTMKKKPDSPEISMILDREYRDHFTVQHTGQHLISALLLKICNAPTVSVHLGIEESTIEVEKQELNKEDLLALEEGVNREIRKARPVQSIVVKTKEELSAYNLRRDTDKIENIRLISIVGLDQTPCGGLHVQNTSDLGLIKYTGMEKIRSRLRLKWKIGAPAYDDYKMRFDRLETISTLLSVKPEETATRLEALISEKQKEHKMLKTLMEKEAERISHDLSGSVFYYPPLITRELEDCPPALFKGIVKNLSSTRDLSFLICTENKGHLNWALHLPQHKTLNFEEFQQKCLSLIEGKGGGKGPLWQGSGQNPKNADLFLKTFRDICHTD
ncbi:alanyl-tRNA editing protein [Oceanispirochaeta sp.]|jgi:alanyl-tRNA synthetase|uniref:alanyl-tRNA editing protein n=1 Tax=Oceanispirochaeta sp. TaxID=2035350 RepID=UPI002637AB14|nr:alanyl-tRNA editing protein [Oceanispirochaeta sp.]MDA3958903.1 alanyl-tRNA editing protein [Oceanispirochaeta sp.]